MDLQGDGATVKSFNHGPGWTRGNKKMTPWEVEEWIHNGPQGSGKWYLDEDGNLQRYNGYSTWGNFIHQEVVSGSPKQPGSIGGDTRPIDSYAQLTVGNSLSTDKTPMIGALDSPPASGAKFGGNSGNPDTTGYGWKPGELEDVQRWIREYEKRQRDKYMPIPMGDNGWSITGPGGMGTGPYVPPTDGPFPGTGNPDAPWDGPNDQQDTFTQADKRLAGTWPEQEYKGAKPGQQTGSLLVDDGRDIRQPLPGRPAYPPIKDWGEIEGNGPWFPPPAGPWPMLPNPGSDGAELMGTTTGSSGGKTGGSGYTPYRQPPRAYGVITPPHHRGRTGGTAKGSAPDNRTLLQKAWDWANKHKWDIALEVGLLALALLEPGPVGEGALLARWGVKFGRRGAAKLGSSLIDDVVRGGAKYSDDITGFIRRAADDSWDEALTRVFRYRNKSTYNMQFGRLLHNEVHKRIKKAILEGNPLFKGEFENAFKQGYRGVDLYNRTTGEWWDLTTNTMRAIRKHLKDYDFLPGPGHVIPYFPPVP